MLKIALNRDHHALIDDCDLPLIEGMKWCVVTSGGGHKYAGLRRKHADGSYAGLSLMHRLLLNVPIGMVVDHIDGDGLNNQRSNLRICSHAENMRNSKDRKHSSTGVRNIEWVEEYKSWRVRILKDGVRHKKRFKDIEAAKAWANEKRAELHGNFAYDQSRDSRIESP